MGFYRVVHDAKHPGDEVPPLPHASTWFSRLQDPAAEASQSQSQPGSHLGKREREPSPAESDIAIERERISLKCPITLLTFIDPVTSTKCPHSFERSAIEDMLKQTTLSKPGPGGRRNRVKYIKCPICSLELTAQDLRTDLPLLRKVKRAEDISQREAEEEEFDGRGSKRRITLGSEMGSEDSEDDEDEATGTMNDPVRIKQEQAAS